MTDQIAIHTEDLTKHYGDVEALVDLDLDVRVGEVFGFLGPNGAGKTTTFYMMVGLIEPDQGRVILGERDVTQSPMFRRARMGIAYLAQEYLIVKSAGNDRNDTGPDPGEGHWVWDANLGDWAWSTDQRPDDGGATGLLKSLLPGKTDVTAGPEVEVRH